MKECVPDENLSQFLIGLLIITEDIRDVSKLAFVIECSKVFEYREWFDYLEMQLDAYLSKFNF